MSARGTGFRPACQAVAQLAEAARTQWRPRAPYLLLDGALAPEVERAIMHSLGIGGGALRVLGPVGRPDASRRCSVCLDKQLPCANSSVGKRAMFSHKQLSRGESGNRARVLTKDQRSHGRLSDRALEL